jgi:hypothetical protein
MHGTGFARAEFQAGCRQAGMPVVAVHEVRFPGGVEAARQSRCRPAQRGETAMIVGIGTALRVFVGIARAVVQAGRVEHIGVYRAAFGAWHGGQRAEQHADGLAPG